MEIKIEAAPEEKKREISQYLKGTFNEYYHEPPRKGEEKKSCGEDVVITSNSEEEEKKREVTERINPPREKEGEKKKDHENEIKREEYGGEQEGLRRRRGRKENNDALPKINIVPDSTRRHIQPDKKMAVKKKQEEEINELYTFAQALCNWANLMIGEEEACL